MPTLNKTPHPLLERPILTFRTRFSKGWGRADTSPPDSEYWGTPRPARYFLKSRWSSDACCVGYVARNSEDVPERFPLLRVDGVSHLQSLRASVSMEWLCLDVDTPKHAPATVEWLEAQLETVRHFLPGAFYGTRSGYRVLWPLTTRLPLGEFKQFFAYLAGGTKKGSKLPVGTLHGKPCEGVLRKAGIPADTACCAFNWRYFAPACKKLAGKDWVDVLPSVCDFSDVQELNPEMHRAEWSQVQVDGPDDRDRTPIDTSTLMNVDSGFAGFLWATVKLELEKRCAILRSLSEGRNIHIRNSAADIARTILVLEVLRPGVRDSALQRMQDELLRAGEDGARLLRLSRDSNQSLAAISSGIRHAEQDPWGSEWVEGELFRYEIIRRGRG